MRSALANRELFLVYQPQVDLATGEVVCARSAAALEAPDARADLPRDRVSRVLEETGLLESIGRWTLQTAARRALATGNATVCRFVVMAINVATRQLFDKGFVDLVDECLQLVETLGSLPGDRADRGEPRDRLSDARRSSVCANLAGRGIGTAIDDFGTGYSSLGYLKELSFDRVKIDRTFIEGLPDEKSLSIVKAVLGIAHSLRKEVIAEGIESEIQRRLLAKLQCDVGQGFLFCRPLLGPAFGEWLSQWEATRLLKEVFASNG